MKFRGNQFGQIGAGDNFCFRQSDCMNAVCEQKRITPRVSFLSVLTYMPVISIRLNRHIQQWQEEIDEVAANSELRQVRQSKLLQGFSYILFQTCLTAIAKGALLRAKATDILSVLLNSKQCPTQQTMPFNKGIHLRLKTFSRTKAGIFVGGVCSKNLAASLADYIGGLTARGFSITSSRTIGKVSLFEYRLSASPAWPIFCLISVFKITGSLAEFLLTLMASVKDEGLAAIKACAASRFVHKTPLTRAADILSGARDVSTRACQAVDQTALAHGRL
jgi:hypothetical protein